MRTRILGAILIAALLPAGAIAEAPVPARLAGWARDAGWRLTARPACPGHEVRLFGAVAARCWRARRRTPTRPGGHTFPRMMLVLARYRGPAAARARLRRFHHVPRGLTGPAEKIWPLRAGLRLGDRVLWVTTDAVAFEGEVRRVAASLAPALGGTELTCWRRCGRARRPVAPAPIRVVDNRTKGWRTLGGRKGTTAFVIAGGPLTAPLAVPFWLDPTDWHDAFKCLDDVRLTVFPLSLGRLYLKEEAPQCGGIEHRVYEPATGRFRRPRYPLSGPVGSYVDTQVLGHDLYFLFAYMEGGGDGQVVRWTPDTRPRPLLEHITSSLPPARAGDGYVLQSRCNPATGRVPPQPDPPGCHLVAGDCDWCATNFGKLFRWRWRPGSAPARLPDEPMTLSCTATVPAAFASKRRRSPTGATEAVDYASSYRSFCWHCIELKAKDSGARCPFMCSGTPGQVQGCTDGAGHGEDQVRALFTHHTADAAEAFLRARASSPEAKAGLAPYFSDAAPKAGTRPSR